MNSTILMAIALLVFGLGYRFYSKLLAEKIARLDDGSPTPAVRFNELKDYVPMKKWSLFFYHYSTIAGAGVIVGPTLAAQYDWLLCILWILIATCLAGGVHDFMVMSLFALLFMLALIAASRSYVEVIRKVIHLKNTSRGSC